MASHEGLPASPAGTTPTGSDRRLADCPACHRTFDLDKPRVVALPVDLRLCPTCNHFNDVQRHDHIPVLMVLPAGWAGALAAGYVLITDVSSRPAGRGLGSDVASKGQQLDARAREPAAGAAGPVEPAVHHAGRGRSAILSRTNAW
jgi:hypothetical protein